MTDSASPLRALARFGPQFDADDPQVYNGMGEESLGDWVKFEDVAALLAASPQPDPNDLGLSIDMLDVDRLREWARLLLVHGADISYWASVPHVASKLQILATNLEKAIRDIGMLRASVKETR